MKEMERRLEGLNELRAQVTSDRSEFVKCEPYEIHQRGTDKSLADLGARISSIEGRFLGLGMAATALSAVALVVSLVSQ